MTSQLLAVAIIVTIAGGIALVVRQRAGSRKSEGLDRD